MGMIYFVGFIAVCAAVFVWLMSRSSRGEKSGGKGRASPRHTQPLYRHQQGSHSLLHSHTGHLPSETRDIWHTRRTHTTEEHWEKGQTLTASRIRSDDEPEANADDEMTMTTIEFTPQEVPRAGGGKR